MKSLLHSLFLHRKLLLTSYQVASKPWWTIGLCWLFVFSSALGFLKFHQEKNPFKLWVPSKSEFSINTQWLFNKFENAYRTEGFILVADDVLTPEVLLTVAEIDQKIKSVITSEGITFKEVCFKIPEIDIDINLLFKSRNSKNGNDSFFDPSVYFNSATYCKLVESFSQECLQRSILELWNFDIEKIKQLSKKEIINKLNSNKNDFLFGNFKNYTELLGNIETNEVGEIVSAKALHIFYMLHVNFSAIDIDTFGNTAGTADWASEDGLKWENEFLKLMESISKNLTSSKIYYESARSFGDISNGTMFQDIGILITGIFVMVLYVQLVISKFNWVEARILLGALGLVPVGMSFIVACGLCSLMGVSYGPVHTSLPFLLMGLGVDDMFVMMASWDDLPSHVKRLPLEKRIGHMLKHAGVSITVTTFTDVVAFLIGSSTILPCLETFCLYAAAGVFMTFVFMVTFFTACFTLDQKRLENIRNGVLPCIKYNHYEKNECSQQRLSYQIFQFVYLKFFFTLPGKILVIIVTLCCFGYSIRSTLDLQQKFDPNWFIPDNTYLGKYLEQKKKYYPLLGNEGAYFMGALNYTHEMHNIKTVVDTLRNYSSIIKINSWVDPFYNFVKHHFKKDVYEDDLTDFEFNNFLSKFLFSPQNAKFQANFGFAAPLECGIPVSQIKWSSVNFWFKRFSGSAEYLPVMHQLTDMANQANYTTGDRISIVWSKMFATWITDELIDIEVMRNLQLALLSVMVCTVLLIANLQMCCWILLCTLLTIIDVCGFMQNWDVSIDMVACIGLELAIGLCVDYSTHIGHTFLTTEGSSREQRSLKTVCTIGSAVLYGGFSFFIGVSMLGTSTAYSFQVFFKIFVLVLIFGLFHGVVLLPVLLCWFGPKPYTTHHEIPQTIEDSK
ncbi:protein patched homolog 1 isoform X2 [Agrilus planipennis]|uniref:Protein patched homolog 1 isoform X2 n=1 Tax=Agrilus planipennis TaxID=224129 RepID=A0A7F5QZ98_AGRPL|nr:protein patched homolog 1 isoform X2 [Agrilus planipennis]